MADRQLGVDVLAAVRHEHAAGIQPRAIAEQFGLQIVAHQRTAEFQHVHGGARARLQAQLAAPDQAGADRRVLQHGGVQARALAQLDLADQRGQLGRLAAGHVLLDQAQLGTLTQLDHAARMPGQVDRRGRTDKHQLHRRADFRVGGHPQHDAVAGAGGVDPRKRLAGFARLPRQREAQRLGIALQCLRQRLQHQPGGQRVQPRQIGAECAVDEHQPRPGHAGQHQRGGVHRVRLRRGIAAGEAALGQRPQRGVFPRLHPRVRQTAGSEGRALFAPHFIQPVDAAGRQRRLQQRCQQRQHGRLAHAAAPVACPA